MSPAPSSHAHAGAGTLVSEAPGSETASAPWSLDAVTDVDAHEMAPVGLWGEIFGQDIHDDVVRAGFGMLSSMGPANTLVRPEITGDVLEISEGTVWETKGPAAPSAIDLDRRSAVLDQMGIARQLVFPSFGILGVILASDPMSHRYLRFDPTVVDGPALGRRIVQAHNDWAARVTTRSDGRVRPVALILPDSVEAMMSQAEAALDRGVRAFLMAARRPPADTSPADPALDPFWRLLSDARAAMTLHIGTDTGALASTRWARNVPAFHPGPGSSLELALEPHRAVTLHFAPDNVLATMVLGGVFERHPDLRFGAIELSAEWAGPLADRLDLWVEARFERRFAASLSARPSEYLARNVRVNPFYFEPVDRYLERHPHLSTMYCYSSDFPHAEGGKHSKRIFSDVLAHAGDDVRRQFFVTNGEWLLPS